MNYYEKDEKKKSPTVYNTDEINYNLNRIQPAEALGYTKSPATAIPTTETNELAPMPKIETPEYDTKKFDWGEEGLEGGIAALNQAPDIVRNLSHDPTTNKEATAKNLSLMASGAQIGGAIVPGWGHLVGGAVGFGAGLIDSAGWKARNRENLDNETIAKIEDDIARRNREYFDAATAEELTAQRNLLAKTMGYSKLS